MSKLLAVPPQMPQSKRKGKYGFQPGNKIGPRWQKGQSGNPGGRARILYEETAEYLRQKHNGKTHARRMVENIVAKAVSDRHDCVGAFRAIHAVVEPVGQSDSVHEGLGAAMTLSMSVIKALAESVRDKQANAYELTE